MQWFFRLSLKTQFGLLIAALIGATTAAAWTVGHSLVVSQTLKQGRAIAQMVEHIGKWGSKYGGVHVRTAAGSATPGSYLERRAYSASAADHAMLSGTRIGSAGAELSALSRAEAYYWKNPALIQREISDISVASSSGAKFRITARSVLNPANAPNEFELHALERISAQMAKPGAAPERANEYMRVEGGRLLYARAMMATDSCLRCHGQQESAPGFLRTNTQFNGGGGFGYESGKPAGIISVSVPLPHADEALADSFTSAGWAALGVIALMSIAILVFVVRKVIAPINALRQATDALASGRLDKGFAVPALGAAASGEASSNEVHRLTAAIVRLGHSLKYMQSRVRQGKSS